MPCNQKFPSTCITDQLLMHRTHAPTHIQIPPAPKSTKPPIPHFFQVHQPPQFPPSPINDNNLGSEHCFGCGITTTTYTTYTLPMCPTHALLTLKSPLFRNQQNHRCPSLPGTPNSVNFHFHISVPITFVPGLAWPGLAPLISHFNSQCFPALKPTKQSTKTKRCSFTLPVYNTDGELNTQSYFCSSETNRNPINESRKLHLQLHGIQ